MLGIYLRLSQEDEESNSIQNQLKEGKAFATKNNYSYKIYNEGQGVSGASKLSNRPVFQSLLDDIDNKKINIVWARNQNRISRSRVIFGKFLSSVDGNKVRVFFNDIEYDLEDATAKLILGVFNEFNSYQVDLQSQQTKKVLLNRVIEGKAHGKATPLGYKTNKEGFLIIDEDERPIVEKIYQMCLDGKGSTTIRHYLNDKNIPTRYNKGKGTFKIKNKDTGKVTLKNKSEVKWSDRQIQSILKNPMYKGKRRWGKVHPDDKEHILYPCDPIFDEVYWEKVQNQYNLNAHSKNTGKKVDHKYLLKGLLECNKCHRNYYGRTRLNKRDNYYMCSSKRYKDLNCTNRAINIDVLDDFVWGLMYDDNLYASMVEMLEKSDNSKRLKTLKGQIEAYTKKIERLQNQIKKSLDYLSNDTINESEYLTIKKQKESKIKTINELKARDKEELTILKNQKINIKEFTKERDNFAKFRISSKIKPKQKLKLVNSRDNIIAPYNEKKRILNNYIKRIFIEYSKEHKVYAIRASFKLPIDDVLHFIDDNYLYSFDTKNSVVMELESGQNSRFTEATYDRTLKKLFSKDLMESLS